MADDISWMFDYIADSLQKSQLAQVSRENPDRVSSKLTILVLLTNAISFNNKKDFSHILSDAWVVICWRNELS